MTGETHEVNLAVHDGSVYFRARPQALRHDLRAIEHAVDALESVTKVRTVVVDMTDIEGLDFDGLQRIMHLQRSLSVRHASVALVHVRRSVKRLLDHLGISDFLGVSELERPSVVN